MCNLEEKQSRVDIKTDLAEKGLPSQLLITHYDNK